MKKAFVFDFDDTLATTDACVLVHNSHFDPKHPCHTTYLSPAEFNVYELEGYERFDFSQFKNPEYILNGRPTRLVQLASEVCSEGHSLFILTARDNSVAGAIQKFLSQFDIEAKAIYCVGDEDKDIARSKRKVLLTIMESYDKTYFYDDDQQNVDLASKVRGLKTYLYNSD